MAGFVASGATFTFCGLAAVATRVSVESPTAEIVDMTPGGAPFGRQVLVPTGAGSGGSVSVDYIMSRGGAGYPSQAVGKVGVVAFSGNVFNISVRAVCESATVDAAVGELCRGTMRFRLTDYTATDQISLPNNSF